MYTYSLDPKYRLKRAKLIADYQFGFGAGNALFDSDCIFILSKTKRVKQILSSNNNRLVSIRSMDGFMTLSIHGAKKLHNYFSYPKMRVVISEEAIPYVSIGKSVFCKHVSFIDSDLNCMDEVLIVDNRDNLVATGQLLLSPIEIINTNIGPAVSVRVGINNER